MNGQQIGHYRLEDQLGRGGFGTVFRAVHTQLPSLKVAVKVVHQNLATDPGFQRLLQKEVEVLHGLQHPGIVSFRDLLVGPDATAIVLELLEGVDLRSALGQGPFAPPEVARVLWEMLQALAYAHRRKVIHRDIKPENIFLCSDGRLKLMDFGIAKVAHSTRASQSGMVSGTLDYMAPERFRQQSPPSSDLYALGLVAWELLTGRLACPDGDIPAKIGWHMGRGAPDVRQLLPDCPVWLAEFVALLCDTHAEKRPADADVALSLLEERWPPPGARRSVPVAPRRKPVSRPPSSTASPVPRGHSQPTLAPSVVGADGNLPLAAKRSTPTWHPAAEASPSRPGPPPPGVSAYREPRPGHEPRRGSPPRGAPPLTQPPSFFREVLPRGFGLIFGVVAVLSVMGGVLLAAAVASTAEPYEQVGLGLGTIALLATPAGALFFFLAGIVDGRALARSLYFGLSALALGGGGVAMTLGMLADAMDLGSSLTGGVCCGLMPLSLPAALSLLFFFRGMSKLKRDRRAFERG